MNKWWDGYKQEKNVLIDEFRGQIGVAHLLRWFDKYRCSVEVKGGTVPLNARKIIITSNIHPRDWYPDLDDETKNALLRRMRIIHFENPF